MANLLYNNIGTNYKGILNLDATTINTPLDATLRAVTDGMGNSSLLQLSTAAVKVSGFNFRNYDNSAGYDAIYPQNTTANDWVLLYGNNSTYLGGKSNLLFWVNGSEQGTLNANGLSIGSGTITQNGKLTIKGSGGNILSLRDSSNVERGYVSNTGIFGVGQKIQFMPNGDFIEGSHNSGYTQIVSGQNCQIVPNGFPFRFLSTGIINLGGGTNAFPAIKRNGAAIDFRLADDSGYCNLNGGVISGTNLVASNNVSVSGILYNNNFWNQSDGGTTIGAQAVPTTSSILDVRSTTKGFLPPRMTTAQVNAIATPENGLQVYNTDLNVICFYDGTGWHKVTHTNM